MRAASFRLTASAKAPASPPKLQRRRKAEATESPIGLVASGFSRKNRRRAHTILLVALAGLLVTFTSLVMLPIGGVSLFRARRLYARIARWCSRRVLSIFGVTLKMHQLAPFPASQAVYISNHTSTLDLFILVALGLPNCRFFLSGFLRKMIPLGIISTMMGTFFTVPQNRPDERRRIFQRAERVLRRTGESVYLSPEGGRVTTGRIGHFNKGSFHLATNLRAPIVPMYFRIPPEVDPGLGFDARPGVVDVYIYPAIDTREWRIADLVANTERVRNFLVRIHEGFSCA